MTDFVSLANAVEECARIVIEHEALNDEPMAFGALRRRGYTSRFIAACWEIIHERAAEIAEASNGATVH